MLVIMALVVFLFVKTYEENKRIAKKEYPVNKHGGQNEVI